MRHLFESSRLALAAGLFLTLSACGKKTDASDGGNGGGGGSVVPTCTDGAMNGAETDVDCGGSCGACALGKACAATTDCAEGVCLQAHCALASCTDGVKDGTESDVDCGGSGCPACAPGHVCSAGADCDSAVCTAGACVAASCGDGAKNGDETGKDCGGTCPNACPDGAGCAQDADCSSGVCTTNLCVAASCADTVKNGNETDTDCGGSCAPCSPGGTCAVAKDCASNVCTAGFCIAAMCTDGVQNGTETGKDCGGSCPQCPTGIGCSVPGDCQSFVCVGSCQAPTCLDMVKNSDETWVDCGGMACGPCDDGLACGSAVDCKSGVCTSNLCQPATCTDGVKNGAETDKDCGGSCGGCYDGYGCAIAGDCQSGVCTSNACAVPSCTDGVKNGTETDKDCGGANCSACGWSHGCSVNTDCVATVACVGNTCSSCAQDQANCDTNVGNGCETPTLVTPTDCGGCGLACSTANLTPSCSNGNCNGACNGGFQDCDGNKRANGCETDTTTDVNNCSSCGLACGSVANGGRACVNSACAVGSCNSGFANCDGLVANGCEKNTQTDVNNCGSCGNVCSVPNGIAGCSNGACVVAGCNAGFLNCDGNPANGCEANTQTDANSCGACGNQCLIPNGTAGCSAGLCTVASCNSGFANCDNNPANGCEKSTNTDVANCGSCGNACSTNNDSPVCSGGTCVLACSPGYWNCDNVLANGCERNTTFDNNNCGGCGNVCSAVNGSATCANSVCRISSCSPGFLNCDNVTGTGCEANVKTDPSNCGACGVTVTDGNACTVDTCQNGVATHTNGLFFSEGFANNIQGWTLGPTWAIGSATVSAATAHGNPDPGVDHTTTADNGVAGAVLGGNCGVSVIAATYLTSPIINLGSAPGPVTLEFWRWLNSDFPPYMTDTVEVFDGSAWVNLFPPPATFIYDSAWTQVQYDVTAYKNANFRVRFGYDIGFTGVFNVSGWNVDDVRVFATGTTCP